MKRIKIISCIVTAAMILGLAAGCSKTKKVTTESVEKACEALDYEEYDVDDLEDGQLEPGDIDDGIYVVIDGDDIEDLAPTILAFSKSPSMKSLKQTTSNQLHSSSRATVWKISQTM